MKWTTRLLSGFLDQVGQRICANLSEVSENNFARIEPLMSAVVSSRDLSTRRTEAVAPLPGTGTPV